MTFKTAGILLQPIVKGTFVSCQIIYFYILLYFRSKFGFKTKDINARSRLWKIEID